MISTRAAKGKREVRGRYASAMRERICLEMAYWSAADAVSFPAGGQKKKQPRFFREARPSGK
jgi:hypothetical protein